MPGGKANYPSSVLMNAIPARVAGVREIIAVVPTPYGEDHGGEGRLIFAAAAVAGVDRLVTIGGAQAIGALAFGTDTIPRVDKITGPGNVYVTAAKKQVFGEVGIDMIAGPSELTVVCDGKTDPDWIAMDLFSQAEHDEQAQSILISTDAAFLDAVHDSIERLLPTMTRADIIRTSLSQRGALILAADKQDALDIATPSPPSTWSSRSTNRNNGSTASATPVPSSSAVTPPRRSATTAQALATSCPPQARPASSRRWVSTTSRSAAQ